MRLAVTRWGWTVAALAMSLAAIELRESGSSSPSPLSVGPPSGLAPLVLVVPVLVPVDVVRVDVEEPSATAANRTHAILDHVMLRRVTEGSWLHEPSSRRAPTLTVRNERPFFFGHVLGGPPPLPAWLVPHYGNRAVLNFHAELDGTAIAIADAAVFLIDRDHRTEAGFDLERFRLFSKAAVPGASPDDNHLYVLDAHRAGSRLIVYANDPQGGAFLAAIDIATGITTWTEQLDHEDDAQGFAISHGFVLTGEKHEVVARELDTGHVVARASSKDGPYLFETRADGSLHGVIEALEADGYTSQIDVSLSN